MGRTLVTQSCANIEDAELLAIQEQWNRSEAKRTQRLLFIQAINLLSNALSSDAYSCNLRQRLFQWVGARISPGTQIVGGGFLSGCRLIIGSDCFINRDYYFDTNGLILLGSNVCVGHGVTFITTDHEIGTLPRRAGKLKVLPIIIEDSVWIAANVTLLPGVTIGRGAVVATGAVVTKDVPPNSLVAGIPAKVIRLLN